MNIVITTGRVRVGLGDQIGSLKMTTVKVSNNKYSPLPVKEVFEFGQPLVGLGPVQLEHFVKKFSDRFILAMFVILLLFFYQFLQIPVFITDRILDPFAIVEVEFFTKIFQL